MQKSKNQLINKKNHYSSSIISVRRKNKNKSYAHYWDVLAKKLKKELIDSSKIL